ncbi:MAG: hypothetical protein KGJ55_05355 [Gammaproteobacteria bacterium]|nr:hypothetical protein [Gammaproteobacteria bacterium]
MKRLVIALLGCGLSSTGLAQPTCPAGAVLPKLDATYHACRHYADDSCHNFITAFKDVTGRYDCKRSFDTAPVPAVWLAGDGALDDYVHLVWLVATKKEYKSKLYGGADAEARAFFASSEFRSILDGALAEEYSEKSEAMAASLKKVGQ